MPATPKSIDPAAVTTAQRQKLTPGNEKRPWDRPGPAHSASASPSNTMDVCG
ncbi:MAG TPA: hypothetical protein VGT60_07255 [Candidatus Limnocylindria bacterium]|nr:hypothetical protein [Candidatus Limnocylindria bacterium]